MIFIRAPLSYKLKKINWLSLSIFLIVLNSGLCVAQISIRHTKQLSQLFVDSLGNIVVIDDTNAILKISDLSLESMPFNAHNAEFPTYFRQTNLFILNDKTFEINDFEIVEQKGITAKESVIKRNKSLRLNRNSEYLLYYNSDNLLCKCELPNQVIIDAILSDKSVFCISEESLFEVCSQRHLQLPFKANSIAKLNDENILISSIENGLWTYRDNALKKYYIPGIDFPRDIVQIFFKEKYLWIYTSTKTLFVFDTIRQILTKVALDVNDFGLDKWNNLHIISKNKVESNSNYINKNLPEIRIENVGINDKLVNNNEELVLSEKDKLTIRTKIYYSPNPRQVILQYRTDKNSNWIGSNNPISIEKMESSSRHLEIRASHDGVYFTKPIDFNLNVQQSLLSSAWFYVFSILTFLFFILGISQFRINKRNRMLSQERKALMLELELLKSKQKFGQLQMNPHFLFNTMNSINGLIALDRKSEARKAITIFSQIMRSVLDFSFEERISIEKEIGFLEDYLQLEQVMRENKFEYEIRTTTNAKHIPPMMIQPFVENAIVHGFQGRKDKTSVIITLEDINKYIKVTIEDNGIGRMAAEMKSPETHESKAVKIIEKRIDMMDKWKAQKAIDYCDLYDGSKAIGTRCILHIPK